MRNPIFQLLKLKLYGPLLLLVLRGYAQMTQPNPSSEITESAETTITTKAQSIRAVLSALGKGVTYREITDVWPQFVSNIPRSLSHSTVIRGKTADSTARPTAEVTRDEVVETSWSSTRSPTFKSAYRVTSVPNATADVATTSPPESHRRFPIEEPPTTLERKAPPTEPAKVSLDSLRASIKQLMLNSGSGFTRKLLQADISTDCSFGLFKFARAIQELEPWALRLVDATAKYPTGLLQGTLVDLGAYDECLETVVLDEQGVEEVRGQYCDVHVLPTEEVDAISKQILLASIFSYKRAPNFQQHTKSGALPGIRLGLCTIDACDEKDLASIARSLVGTVVNVTVKDCVTGVQKGLSRTQASIIAFLAVLVTVILAATAFEVFTKSWDKHRKTARVYNAFLLFEQWDAVLITAGYLCVDTFFFLSGYLLYDGLNKQNKNRAVVAVIALLRRFIRITVPLFFMIMCMYLLPLIAQGPNSKEFYDRFYKEIHEHWWHLLAQIRNWKMDNVQTSTMLHLWYLSADYQLFLVSVIVIQVFRPKKWRVAAVFSALSLACCVACAWQLYGTEMMPFNVSNHPKFRAVIDTAKYLYPRPYYHAVCFFFGCVTFILVEKYRKAHISKTVQTSLWIASLFCGLYCISLKAEWHRMDYVPLIAKRMVFIFIDRILWTVFLVWLAFTCTTGRGGFLNRFLSWNVFPPLARLCFGVYLIHFPFYTLARRLVRERIYYSHYVLVSDSFAVLMWSYMLSYFLSILCEAPVGKLEKLVFMRGQRRGTAQPSSTQNEVHYNSKEGTDDWAERTTKFDTTNYCLKEDCFTPGKGAHFNESCDIVRCHL